MNGTQATDHGADFLGVERTDKVAGMTENNQAIVRQFIEMIINQREESCAARFLSPNCIDSMIQHIHAVRSTYPDLKVVIHGQIAEGDMAVSRVRITGTHEGNWLGMKPTHQQVAIDAVNIHHLENGLIVEHWGVANRLKALLDIGAIDPGRHPS